MILLGFILQKIGWSENPTALRTRFIFRFLFPGANNSNLVGRNRVLNSKVISASLGKGRHIQLSQPIRLILKHLKIENVSNPQCVFWNYIDQ